MGNGAGRTVTVTPASGTNYAGPGAITTSGLTTTLSWTSFLGPSSEPGPNGESGAVSYDIYGRVFGVNSPTGAGVGYGYSSSAPWTKTVTIAGGGWTKHSLDALGSGVKAETGTGTTVSSVVDTEYAPCACSPFGKVWRVSQRYTPGGTVYWTTYTYDARGRTTRVDLPGGTGTTTYVYEGNTVKVTDPAGRWKKYTMDKAVT